MWLPPRRWVFAATILLALICGLAVLVVYPDYRAGKRYIRDLKRDARGPWPSDSVAQAVIVRCPTGSSDVSVVEAQLRDLLTKNALGHVDGSECLDARCSLFLYGPDARQLFEAVRPVLKESLATRHASIFLRLGRGDANAPVMDEARW
jgi:hypothetical protein